MLTIVFYHSIRIFAGGGTWGPYPPVNEAPVLGYISEWFNNFHIYAFTLISGYIFYYIKYERGRYQKYTSFIYNKAKRLLVPYVFSLVVWVVPVHAFYFGTDDLVKNYLLGASPSQLWFLLMLFWVFAIFWLISDMICEKPLFGGIIICALYCIGLLMPSIYCFNSGLMYLLFFYIGFLIRSFDLGNKFLYRVPSLMYLVIDIGLFIVYKFIGGFDGILFIKGMFLGCGILLHIVGAIGAFVILQRFVKRFLQGNKVIDFLGKHSMVVYLFHQQLIYFSIGRFNGVVPPIVLALINFAFSLSISIVISVLMHKTKITKVLVGSK